MLLRSGKQYLNEVCLRSGRKYIRKLAMVKRGRGGQIQTLQTLQPQPQPQPQPQSQLSNVVYYYEEQEQHCNLINANSVRLYLSIVVFSIFVFPIL